MTRPVRLTMAELRRLARLARETGAAVEIIHGETAVRIGAGSATVTETPEANTCDRVWGRREGTAS